MFFWENLGTIRENPSSYLAPKGLPSLEKGAKEERGFGLFDVTFPHFNPNGMEGEQPSIGITIRVLEEADQSELVFTGIPEVWKRPNGTYLIRFRKFQDAVGQEGALLLPFKRNDQWNLTRLLLQIRGKFEPLV